MSETPTFSAALIAGGKSSRMGRDKALLPLPGSGLLLWQWQLRVLEELRPGEIFWSGPARPGLPTRLRIVPDEIENAGPLAGLAACLQVLRSDLLIVLAIDLPMMTAAFLAGLQVRCSAMRGIVAKNGDYFEPLAAIYPRSLAPLAAEQLARGDFALQALVRRAAAENLVDVLPLAAKDAPLFRNVNAPADL